MNNKTIKTDLLIQLEEAKQRIKNPHSEKDKLYYNSLPKEIKIGLTVFRLPMWLSSLGLSNKEKYNCFLHYMKLKEDDFKSAIENKDYINIYTIAIGEDNITTAKISDNEIPEEFRKNIKII